MKFKTSFVLLALGAAPYAKAQTTEPAQCTNTTFQWAFNSRDQSPCIVAGYLGGVCNAGPCQDRNYLRWSPFSMNCSQVYDGLFPDNIPSGTAVPSWAYLNVTGSDTWNLGQALDNRQGPESTGASKPTGSTPSALASSTPSEASQPDPGSKTNAGAIAGGVIGGVVFLGIVAGIAFWLYRRRRDQHDTGSHYVDASFDVNTSHLPPTSMSPASDQTRFGSPEMGRSSHIMCNPSDPNTFPDAIARMQSPTNTYTSHAHSNSIESVRAGNTVSSVYSTPTHHRNYSGAAEI
ncbi:hypothetical protein VNI00_003200 [Paramarasmius palmivorus]|uniref:Uncharacterized protein n=1 Tax=Paramarasmius palmivorus TaxID=297713 RepID=A0AAW0DVL4_9AGAR